MATVSLSNNYKYIGKGPVDVKALVRTYADLLNLETWQITNDSGTTTNIAYNGMVVSVGLDTSNPELNGIYQLYDATVTSALSVPNVALEENWHKIATSADVIAVNDRIDSEISTVNTSVQSLAADTETEITNIHSDITELTEATEALTNETTDIVNTVASLAATAARELKVDLNTYANKAILGTEEEAISIGEELASTISAFKESLAPGTAHISIQFYFGEPLTSVVAAPYQFLSEVAYASDCDYYMESHAEATTCTLYLNGLKNSTFYNFNLSCTQPESQIRVANCENISFIGCSFANIDSDTAQGGDVFRAYHSSGIYLENCTLTRGSYDTFGGNQLHWIILQNNSTDTGWCMFENCILKGYKKLKETLPEAKLLAFGAENITNSNYLVTVDNCYFDTLDKISYYDISPTSAKFAIIDGGEANPHIEGWGDLKWFDTLWTKGVVVPAALDETGRANMLVQLNEGRGTDPVPFSIQTVDGVDYIAYSSKNSAGVVTTTVYTPGVVAAPIFYAHVSLTKLTSKSGLLSISGFLRNLTGYIAPHFDENGNISKIQDYNKGYLISMSAIESILGVTFRKLGSPNSRITGSWTVSPTPEYFKTNIEPYDYTFVNATSDVREDDITPGREHIKYANFSFGSCMLVTHHAETYNVSSLNLAFLPSDGTSPPEDTAWQIMNPNGIGSRRKVDLHNVYVEWE